MLLFLLKLTLKLLSCFSGGFLDIGVERIVDQVVNPKINQVFLPQVKDVVYERLGIKQPKTSEESQGK